MTPLIMNTALSVSSLKQLCFSEIHAQYRHERITMQQVAANYRNVGSLTLFVLIETLDFRSHARSKEQPKYGQ